MTYKFPDNFTWGTATAAYQVEGAAHEDGKVPSIWDTFCALPGKIEDRSSGNVACDEYHRYPQDIALMKEMGVGAYRMSIAWSRIISDEAGTVNPKGIEHYIRMLDMLRENGIKPVATLYHWDLPQYLQDRGGWASRDTAFKFADYAAVLADAFGGRVDTWTTLNEPWCTAFLGYAGDYHAPGIGDPAQGFAAVHHLNLAHGLAVQAIHSHLGENTRTSVTLNLNTAIAETDSPEDLAAKRRAKLMANDIFLGPMMEGRYNPEIFEATKEVTDWSFVRDRDVETAHQPIQVLGLNYYAPNHVRAATEQERVEIDAGTRRAGDVGQRYIVSVPSKGQVSATGWSLEPEGLVEILTEMGTRYPNVELAVTENGSAWDDVVEEEPDAPGGKIVHDPNRVKYMDMHIRALAEVLQKGINLTGYYVWSLLDNFEWASGYKIRFGIIRTDYDTQERIWKDSGLRYKEIVQSHSID